MIHTESKLMLENAQVHVLAAMWNLAKETGTKGNVYISEACFAFFQI